MASTDTPIWFVNGASSGFGEAVATEALSRDYKVIATARKTSSMKDLGEAGASLLALDVTSDDATIAAVAQEAAAIHGGITHLVNCAGHILEGMVEEASSQEVHDVFNTNVFGTLRVIRAVLPHMRATASSAPKVVANLGSSGSWTAWPATGVYCSTKWAISGLTEGLAMELEPEGIRAVVIEPGTFRTDFHSLAPGRRQCAEKHLPQYRETRNGIHGFMNSGHEALLGEPAKAGRVIVDVLTATGAAQGREIPGRLLLGSDSIDVVGKKCIDTLKLIEEWSDTIKSTDHNAS